MPCWRCSERELARSGKYLWAFGPWCLDLADVRPLATPIPARGRLGIYRRPELGPIAATLPLEEPGLPAANKHAKGDQRG